MSFRSTKTLEISVAVVGLIAGGLGGLWLATRPAEFWQPKPVLASIRAQAVSAKDKALGAKTRAVSAKDKAVSRHVASASRGSTVAKPYAEQFTEFVPLRTLLMLGAVLVAAGLAVNMAMGRIGERNRLQWRESERRAMRSLVRPPTLPSSPHVGAGSFR